uniref:G protein-coupled receptor n=1 Tax=Caenorhabditis tropicalis TaxID=1561998 RepID=A0A1I7V1Q2_9PELO
MAMPLLIIQVDFLVLCFQSKHQTIATLLHQHVAPKFSIYFGYFLCLASITGFTGGFYTIHLDKEEQWEFITKNFPQYLPNFQTLTHFDVYIKSPSLSLQLKAIIGGGFIVLCFYLFLIIDIFRMMAELRLKISAHRYKRHWEAIQNLLVQLAMSSFCLIPPSSVVVIIFLELENAQLLTELCIAWFAMHSSANVLSLVIFFPPYRNFVIKQLLL